MSENNAVDHHAMRKPPVEGSRDWRGFSQQVAREANDLLGGMVFLHPGDTHLKFPASKAGNKVKQDAMRCESSVFRTFLKRCYQRFLWVETKRMKGKPSAIIAQAAGRGTVEVILVLK